jgi:hypothetical protein
MKKPGWPRLWVPIFICTVYSLTLPFAYGADKPDKREIVKQARQAYYNLGDHGLTGFQSNVQPNWRLVLKDQIAADPANAETALKMLNGIHFTVSLGPDGVVKVTHHVDVAPSNEKVAEGFNQIFSGMEQAMSGFFDTWKPFMLTSPFPAVNGDYQLEELDNQYHLSYKDDTADVATTMSKELLISEIKVDSPAFKSVLKPVFSKNPQGFLLTGYDATYQEPSGKVGVQLKVQIDYQQVNGFQLPNKLNLTGSYQGTPFAMELTFSDYQVKSH